MSSREEVDAIKRDVDGFVAHESLTRRVGFLLNEISHIQGTTAWQFAPGERLAAWRECVDALESAFSTFQMRDRQLETESQGLVPASGLQAGFAPAASRGEKVLPVSEGGSTASLGGGGGFFPKRHTKPRSTAESIWTSYRN